MKQTFFLIFSALCLLSASRATAQVIIGADISVNPQPFSLLELESSGTRGFRLPQMTTGQRDALTLTGEDAARGLQIFNIFTKCVETWNGSKWIQQCPPEGPAVSPISPSSAVTCGITSTDNCTFTAVDTEAEYYEFFLSGKSQGVQSSNSITFPTSQTVADVSVKYYYPPSFLKPKMLPVEGSSSWHWGTANSYVGTHTTEKILDFKMSETEVTQAQFEYVMGTNPSEFQCGDADYGKYVTSRPTSALPVENVNWYHAIAYCNKLSLKENKTQCYTVNNVNFDTLTYKGIPTNFYHADIAKWNAATCDFSKDGYRLPTESEWEYAARGGVTEPSDHHIYSGSNDDLCEFGWFDNNNNKDTKCADPVRSTYGPKPVKKKTANELGLHDMSGNVFEWCWNCWYDETFPKATPTSEVQSSCTSSSTSHRISRGGRWGTNNAQCRVSFRDYYYPNGGGFDIGFRVAASIVPASE
jgi:formylglycine-generating enzyme required for sulfatase activity